MTMTAKWKRRCTACDRPTPVKMGGDLHKHRNPATGEVCDRDDGFNYNDPLPEDNPGKFLQQ